MAWSEPSRQLGIRNGCSNEQNSDKAVASATFASAAIHAWSAAQTLPEGHIEKAYARTPPSCSSQLIQSLPEWPGRNAPYCGESRRREKKQCSSPSSPVIEGFSYAAATSDLTSTRTVAKRNIAKKKSNRKSHGGDHKIRKYSDQSDSDGSDYVDDREDKIEEKKSRRHSRKTQNRRKVFPRDRDSDLGGSSGELCVPLLERWDQSDTCSEFESDDDERRKKRRWRKQRVLRRLNKLITCVACYREYKVLSNSVYYQEIFRNVPRLRTRIHVRMRPHMFFDSDRSLLSYRKKAP